MKSLRVRRADTTDAKEIAAIYAPFVLETVISFEADAPTAAEMQYRMEQGSGDYPWLVATDEGRVVGYAYASRHHARAAYQWSADVTIYLAASYRGKGHGAKLYRMLFSLLRRQGHRSLYASITLPNDASVGLHRSMGMSEIVVYRNVGFKFGAWRDVVRMGLSFDDARAPSGPPLRFGALPREEIDTLLNAGVD